MKIDMEQMDVGKQASDLKIQVINISGTRFEVSEDRWATISKNISKDSQHELQTKGTEVFLERHPGVFQSILYFHQGGGLHLPIDVCPSSFKLELGFWGVDEATMAKCCYTKYINYFDDQDVLKILENDETQKRTETSMLLQMKSKGGWRGLQASVWLILNEPFHSKAAKVYFVASAILILVSLFALIAGTHPTFQRGLTIDEWETYFGDNWDKYKHHFMPAAEPESETEPETKPEATAEPETESEPESETEPETTSEPESTSEPETTSEPESTSEPETTSEPESTSEPETSSEPESTSEPEAVSEEPAPIPENAYARFIYLEYIEYICVCAFTLDILIRFFFCPFRYKLLVSFLNWVDIFAVVVMYIRYIVEALYPKEKYEASVLDVIHCLQIVRVFRLFRLVKNFVGFRVLMYAFKASLKEMMLMSLFLLIAMLVFSTFAYFSGDPTFVSIPDAFWWAVVTMTTVGYGDVVPKQGLSKIIGVVCAVCGVCLIAVIIPIFVNNFMLFYSYSKVWGKQYENDQQTKHNKIKITQVVSLDQLQENKTTKY